jgi:hypothetical protein
VAKRLDKPTQRMRSAAWRALHAIAIDDGAGSTARVSAARALVRPDDDEQQAAEAEAAKVSRGRPAIICLPDNGSSPPGTPLGPRWIEGGCVQIIFDGDTEQGRAELSVWLLEVSATLDKQFPPEMLALPAPVKPVPMTAAERKRAQRARAKLKALAA